MNKEIISNYEFFLHIKNSFLKYKITFEICLFIKFLGYSFNSSVVTILLITFFENAFFTKQVLLINYFLN